MTDNPTRQSADTPKCGECGCAIYDDQNGDHGDHRAAAVETPTAERWELAKASADKMAAELQASREADARECEGLVVETPTEPSGGEPFVAEANERIRELEQRIKELEGERIVAAAILYSGVVHVIAAPARHHTIIHAMVESGHAKPIGGTQGFITSAGRFVDREEGARIAASAGQINSAEYPRDMLFSEDVW
jgi:hypothetical protein